MRLRGLSSGNDIAAVAKGRRPGVGHAIVKLTPTPQDVKACAIGHAAYVDFPEVSVIDLLRARLRPTDDLIVAWADALGSLFVAGYMTISGLQVLRAAVPDLLDRSAGLAVHRAIDEVLAGHAASYARVQRIRGRRGGHTVFVEIALELDPSLDFAEVDRRVGELKSTLRERLDDADIAILASAS